MTTVDERHCAACGKPLPAKSHTRRKFCPEKCGHMKRPAPAVYRYVCPDGRCYVGSVVNHRNRNNCGLSRSNPWIDEAVATYPVETWSFEILKKLPPGCTEQRLRRAEQRCIERFRSWNPERGFNVHPAWWFGNTPGILAARERCAEQMRRTMMREKQRAANWRAEREAASTAPPESARAKREQAA